MMQVKNGDLDKLGLLFERYHQMLYKFFYRMCRKADTSEDLVQIVFERMLKYRYTYSGNGTFTTWMFSIARNAHIDHYRKEKKMSSSVEFDENRQMTNQSGEQVLDRIEDMKQLLERALDQLDEDKKEIILLSRYEGLNYKEIAEIMDSTEGAIKVRMFRALKELKGIADTIEKDYHHE